MCKNSSLETLISNIDKITSGDPVDPSGFEHCDEECKELLLLARLLVKADYTPESQGGMEKIMAKMQEKNELENDEIDDDELDMVAGGVNLNEILDEDKKKN